MNIATHKEKHLIGTGLWAHSCYSREHSDAQADIVLEKEPVVLHLHQQVSGRKSGWATGSGLNL